MGGASISFINMLNGLIDKGVQPFVVIPRTGKRDETFMEYLRENNIRFANVFLTMSALHRPCDLISYLRFPFSFFSFV